MRRDDEIKSDILDELVWDPEVEMAEIGVAVHDGAVTLTGIVETYPERCAAERAAKRVKGVVTVAQDIKVALSGERVEDDSEVARRIAHVLEWDPAISHGRVQADVRNGDVVLSGEVEWHFQRETIESHVIRIGGVRSLVNDIRVARPATKREIKKEIVRALHRNADVEASHIDVDVVDGRVRLGGRVKALYEKDLVKNAVWSAPGVDVIEDDLNVG